MPPKAQSVRAHTRKTADGTTTTVRQHSRTGRPRKAPLFTPRHALKMARKAFTAGKRRRRWTAAALGGLALGEIVIWGSLQGVTLIAATAGVLALSVAVLAGSATGTATPSFGHSGTTSKKKRGRS